MARNISLFEADSGHWYFIEDPSENWSIWLRSATNILDSFPNPDIKFWLSNTMPEEIRKKQEEGKIQGTKVHKAIELQIMGDTVNIEGITDEQIQKLGVKEKSLVNYLKQPFTKREEEALNGAENFWKDYQPITIASELMVYNLWWIHKVSGKNILHKDYLKLSELQRLDYYMTGYAGTLDWFGYLWEWDKKPRAKKGEEPPERTGKYNLWLVDWKISKMLDLSYDSQVAAYWKGFIFAFRKKVNPRLGILQLGKNKCNYSFKEVKNKEKAWEMFLVTKQLSDYCNPEREPSKVERQQEFKLPEFKKKGKKLTLE